MLDGSNSVNANIFPDKPKQQNKGSYAHELVYNNGIKSFEGFVKTQEASKNSSALKKIWEGFVWLAPILYLTSGALLMAGQKNRFLDSKIKDPLLKTVSSLIKRKTTDAKGLNAILETSAKKMLSAGCTFTNINGISAGIVCAQPSMILNNLINLPISFYISKTKKDLPYIQALQFFLGGLYTVGFAGELKNKSLTPSEQRKYNMEKFKKAFSLKSALNPAQRAFTVLEESFRMLGFIAVDHLLLIKDLFKLSLKLPEKLGKLISKTPETVADFIINPTDAVAVSANKIVDATNDLSKPHHELSQIGAFLVYISSLPLVLFMPKNPKLANNKLIQTLKAAAGITSNLTLFSLALHSKGVKNKVPVIGVPLSVIGSAKANNNFFVGMCNTGEGLNNVFFSEVAVNGLNGEK